MRTLGILSIVSVFTILICGCPPEPPRDRLPANPTGSGCYPVYAPVKVRIVGLTSFIPQIYGLDQTELEVYVDMLDAYDSRIKAAGIFQFELYEYVRRSSENKGKQIYVWPKIDLNKQETNHEKWRDYLRAYQFNLTMDKKLKGPATYVLQVTCTIPNDKRLEHDFIIEYEK